MASLLLPFQRITMVSRKRLELQPKGKKIIAPSHATL